MSTSNSSANVPSSETKAEAKKGPKGFLNWLGGGIIFALGTITLLAILLAAGVYALNRYDIVKYESWESAYNTLTGKKASANEPVFENAGKVKAATVTVAGKEVVVKELTPAVQNGVAWQPIDDTLVLGDPRFAKAVDYAPLGALRATPVVHDIVVPGCKTRINPGQAWNCVMRIDAPNGDEFMLVNGGEYAGVVYTQKADGTHGISELHEKCTNRAFRMHRVVDGKQGPRVTHYR